MSSKQTHRLGIILAVAVMSATASRALAQSDARVEAWGGVAGVTMGPSGSLVSDYSPPLLLDGDFMSRGGQSISITSSFAVGVGGGINLFPSRHLGVQLLVDRGNVDINATSSPYAFTLKYISRLPPNNEPQGVTFDRSVAWPDGSGSVTRLTFALNVVTRIGIAHGVTATISGGPTITRLDGTLEPIGYTAFQLGGHSVLFEDDYRLAGAFAETVFGVNGGGEISIAAGRHIALIVGYRYFGGRDVDASVTAAGIVNPTELTFAQPLGEVSSAFAAQTRLSTSSSRFLIGVKYFR